MNMKMTTQFILPGLTAMALLLSGCSDVFDNDKKRSDPNLVTLTGLVDDIFYAEAESEPVAINDLIINDNADQYSFDYLLQGE